MQSSITPAQMVRVEPRCERKIIHPLLTANDYNNDKNALTHTRYQIHFNQVIVFARFACAPQHCSDSKLYHALLLYWKSFSHLETIKIEHHSWVNKTNNVNTHTHTKKENQIYQMDFPIKENRRTANGDEQKAVWQPMRPMRWFQKVIPASGIRHPSHPKFGCGTG